MKDTDLPAQPKCQNDTGESLGVEKDKRNKKDGNDAKKATSVKSGSVAIEKKGANSKPAMVQVRAPLSKVHLLLYILMLYFHELSIIHIWVLNNDKCLLSLHTICSLNNSIIGCLVICLFTSAIWKVGFRIVYCKCGAT